MKSNVTWTEEKTQFLFILVHYTFFYPLLHDSSTNGSGFLPNYVFGEITSTVRRVSREDFTHRVRVVVKGGGTVGELSPYFPEGEGRSRPIREERRRRGRVKSPTDDRRVNKR